uniref:BkdR transcription regulator-like protein n=1 Tax=Agrobacterium tumefaciens TaxID=358 RepID=Q9AHE9_AGRTU|nr:BkdR transcription regulator-like protein [Agrobacterium tumefaciens]
MHEDERTIGVIEVEIASQLVRSELVGKSAIFRCRGESCGSLLRIAASNSRIRSIRAIVRIRPLPGKLHVVQTLIAEDPQIVECDKVTGDDCFFARLHVGSIQQLDEILDRVADKAETSTAIVKAQPVKRRLVPLV